MTDERIGRLLGPDREPLSCETCFDELDRYVEWKLDGGGDPVERCVICEQPHECSNEGECLAMQAHLESCKACDEEYESLRELVLAERGG